MLRKKLIALIYLNFMSKYAAFIRHFKKYITLQNCIKHRYMFILYIQRQITADPIVRLCIFFIALPEKDLFYLIHLT